MSSLVTDAASVSATAAPTVIAHLPDPAWNHALHIHALCRPQPGLRASYARLDRKARGRTVLPEPLVVAEDLDIAGTPSDGLDREWDRPWFQQRWQLGDEQVLTTAGAHLADALRQLPTPFPADTPLTLRLSGALEDDAWADRRRDGATLTAGLAVNPMRAQLALLAARLETLVPDADLNHDDARYLRRQVAATLWFRASDESLIDELLAAVAGSELPTRYDGPDFISRIERIAPRLDQPPGEIVRLSKGMSRRYTDRLHRAWERGFFLPRDTNVAHLVEALGAAQ